MARENWWDEEAERLNGMSAAANKMGVVVDVKAKVPRLAPDGSLAVPFKKTTPIPGDAHTANESTFERDLEMTANEFGLDKEQLRDEYAKRIAEGS